MAPDERPTPEQLLARARTIAVVGFSADPRKPSHRAPMELVRRGWHVIPVNPNESEVAGMRSYPTLADVPEAIDLVNVFRPSAETPAHAHAAVEVGASTLWLQLGITSDQARRIAQEAGLDYVEDLCAGALARSREITPAP